MRSFVPCASFAFLVIGAFPIQGQTEAQLEIFEKNARPIFSEKCQGCHNAKLKSGGLDLSSPSGIKEAAGQGFFGTAAEPDKRLLLQAISYAGRVRMPQQGKLVTET